MASICVVLHFCFGACPIHTYFYGAVIVDLFIVILTVTLREIAAVFVMLGCCEFRNEMYKCSCWVSLFLYFCAPIFCYCLVNCKCNHRVFITHGWHTFRYDATGKTITLFSKIVKLSGKFRKFLVSDWWNQGSLMKLGLFSLNEILIPKTKTKFWEWAHTQLKPVPVICQISAGNSSPGSFWHRLSL